MTWQDKLNEAYPKALAFEEFSEALKAKLTQRGFTPENTLFASGFCRDEINTFALDLLIHFWGEDFFLGGLAGFPSAGATGLGACISHVPDDGKLLVVYGPHIGISETGEIGKVNRPGLNKESSTCGALAAILGKVNANRSYHSENDPLDLEQSALEDILIDQALNSIDQADSIKQFTEATFKVIDKRMHELIERVECDKEIALVGGILINTPPVEGTLSTSFTVRSSSIISKDGQTTENWLENV